MYHAYLYSKSLSWKRCILRKYVCIGIGIASRHFPPIDWRADPKKMCFPPPQCSLTLRTSPSLSSPREQKYVPPGESRRNRLIRSRPLMFSSITRGLLLRGSMLSEISENSPGSLSRSLRRPRRLIVFDVRIPIGKIPRDFRDPSVARRERLVLYRAIRHLASFLCWERCGQKLMLLERVGMCLCI